MSAPRVRRVVGVVVLSVWQLCVAVAAAGAATSLPQAPALDPPSLTREALPPGGQYAPEASGPYSHGNPTPEEQYMLELVNRARADPPGEGLRLRSTTDPDVLSGYSFFHVDLNQLVSDFAGYPARPPLAFNANLIAAARGHSQDMAVNNFQGHFGSDGSSFDERIEAAGYTSWNALAENVYAYAKSVFHAHAGFNVDWGVPGVGHRLNIMNFVDPVYREIGIGIVHEDVPSTAVGPFVVTQDFGRRSNQFFVVGVVYRDTDHDGFYSVGEGVAGIAITTSQGNYAVTSASGGYAVPLSLTAGNLTVRAEGTALGAAQERTFTLAGANIKVDFVVGAQPLDVARIGAGSGAVTSNPTGIDCGEDCGEWYPSGAAVTLVATPLAGSTFTGWTVGCTGTKSCALSMSTARSVSAAFAASNAASADSNSWVQKSYVAYYGRPSDPAGQAYWAARMDREGGSLDSIIGAFGTSDEFNRRYGALGYLDLVTKIYQQALGRNPEQGGLDYYVGELQAGRKTLQTITLDVLNGATGTDALTVANRLDVANHYTGKVAMGCAYGTEQTGVSSLAAVTEDLATVFAAKAAIETRCGF